MRQLSGVSEGMYCRVCTYIGVASLEGQRLVILSIGIKQRPPKIVVRWI